jgi:hypothetical protein
MKMSNIPMMMGGIVNKYSSPAFSSIANIRNPRIPSKKFQKPVPPAPN